MLYLTARDPLSILTAVAGTKLLRRIARLTSKRKFYFRMLTAYAFFTVGAILLSSLALLGYARTFLRDEIEISNRRLLAQVQIFMDRSVIQEVYGVVNREFLNPATSGVIADFFTMREQPPDFYLYLKNALSGISLSSDYIDSIYLHRIRDGTLVHSEAGVTFDVSSRKLPNLGPINLQILELAHGIEGHSAWISPDENLGFPRARPIVSYVRTIPLYGPREQSAGYVIINVDEAAVIRAIQEIHYTENSELMTIDAWGRVLTHTRRGALFQPLPFDASPITAEQSGFLVSSVRRQPVGISWIKSTAGDWYYVSLTAMSTLNQRLLSLRKMTMIVLLIAVVFSLTVLIALTFLLYRPLRRLVFAMRRQLDVPSEDKGDIDFISDAFSGLLNRVGEMQETLDENRKLIEHKMINDILLGNVKDPAAILRRIAYVGLDAHPPEFSILLIDIERRRFQLLRYGPREYVTLRVNDLIRDFFNRAAISVSYEPGRVAALVEAQRTAGMEDIASLVRLIEDRIGLRSNAAWSACASPPKALARSFSAMRSLEHYGFIHGYGNVFSMSDLEDMEKNTIEIGVQEILRVQDLVRTGRADEFSAFLSRFAEKTVGAKSSYASAILCLNQLFAIVIRTFKDQDVEIEALPAEVQRLQLTESASIWEAVEVIRRIAEALDAERTRRIRRIDGRFMNRIKEHITRTIGRQTSLVSVAEEFGISPGHLSRLFKEAEGTSFSDFVIECRLRRAAQLLANDLGKNVTSVGREVGYDNQSYFARLFRRRYGMSPIQFRKNRRAAFV